MVNKDGKTDDAGENAPKADTVPATQASVNSEQLDKNQPFTPDSDDARPFMEVGDEGVDKEMQALVKAVRDRLREGKPSGWERS